MTGEIMTLVVLALVIALLSLDQSAIGQFMISTPLVGGSILGILLGKPIEGMTAGALMQFLCCMELPVGASLPPDGSLAGLLGVALFLNASRPPLWGDGAMLGLAALLFFPLAYLGRSLEMAVRRANRYWTEAVSEQIVRGNLGRAQLATLGGIPVFFVKSFLFSLAVLLLFEVLSSLSPQAVSSLADPLLLIGRLVPFVCLGALAVGQRRVHPPRFIALGFLVGLLFFRNSG